MSEGPADVPEIGMTQPKPVTPTQVRASELFGNRNKIDSGVHWYRLGQRYGYFLYDKDKGELHPHGKKFLTALEAWSPPGAEYFLRGISEGWGEDD